MPLPTDIYYSIFEFIEFKELIRINLFIKSFFDINKITCHNIIRIKNADDLEGLNEQVYFKHLIIKNVLTDIDGDKLIRKENITGDKLTITFDTRKNLINMAVFTKFFKKCFISINCNRHSIIYNVICNLFSRDEQEYNEIQINYAKIKCLDYKYSVGKIHHFIFNKCVPLTEDDKKHISSSCDKLTIIN
jgi:hypothetical protein